jgi:2-oxoglutarate ferredoxin oxidoreductase subunit delta
MARGSVRFEIDTCKGCELCIEACPQESIELSPGINKQGYHYAVLVKDNCTGCTNCALVCPDAVITVYREDKKKKTPVAKISNITENISLTISDSGGAAGALN